nr:TPA_asm: ND4L [Marinogammarus marinus]
MMESVKLVVVLGVLSGCLSFVLNLSHLLSSLLSLEFLALVLYWWLSSVIFYGGGDFFFVLFFLVMAVSEGVLGLSLLVMSAHSHGSDQLKLYSAMVC